MTLEIHTLWFAASSRAMITAEGALTGDRLPELALGPETRVQPIHPLK